MERVAKFIAASGICSRREAERLIAAGEVTIDGSIITSPAINVTDQNVILVKGKLAQKPLNEKLWGYYKPVGMITSHNDPEKRSTVFEALKDKLPRVISIGRLDINSEGLLLLTNSGRIAHYMESPKNNIERTYLVRAYGDCNKVRFFGKPIVIEGIKYTPKSIKLVQLVKSNSWFEVVLAEGKNREIRKIFEHFGLKVSRLIRTKYGKYELGDLKSGQYKLLQISNGL